MDLFEERSDQQVPFDVRNDSKEIRHPSISHRHVVYTFQSVVFKQVTDIVDNSPKLSKEKCIKATIFHRSSCSKIYFLTVRLEEWKTGSGGKGWNSRVRVQPQNLRQGFPKSPAWAVSSLYTELTPEASPAGPGLGSGNGNS